MSKPKIAHRVAVMADIEAESKAELIKKIIHELREIPKNFLSGSFYLGGAAATRIETLENNSDPSVD
ncbi:MAG: hypothetical protein PHG67_05995 [Bacteroidales bacterium]|nr:hypothetical protein [Bacteroidales bacterium]